MTPEREAAREAFLVEEGVRLKAEVERLKDERDAFPPMLEECEADREIDCAEIERLRALEASVKGLIAYCDRNTLNFQREKVMDFVQQMQAALAAAGGE